MVHGYTGTSRRIFATCCNLATNQRWGEAPALLLSTESMEVKIQPTSQSPGSLEMWQHLVETPPGVGILQICILVCFTVWPLAWGQALRTSDFSSSMLWLSISSWNKIAVFTAAQNIEPGSQKLFPALTCSGHLIPDTWVSQLCLDASF